MERPVVVLLLLLAAAVARADEPVPIRGTRVRLVVPDGFQVARDFPGIGREEDLTSVLVSELPLPLQASREQFTPERLLEQGVSVHRTVEVSVGRWKGLLIHATQRIAGVEFRKWLLLIGDETASVLITATTPLDLEAVYQKPLVETLRSVVWDPDRPLPSQGALRFRVREVAPLRIVSTSDNAVVLADPSRTAGPAVPPLVSVGSSRARVQISDLPAFARERLEQTPSIEKIELESQRACHLGQLPCHEITARAKDVQTGRAVEVTQLLATDGERYYLLQGIADAEEAASFAPLLGRVIDSFALEK